MKVNSKEMQKLRTRSLLLRSALNLMGENRSLDSLSLREVTREAGVAPAAFYRHFQSIEELGLSLVDEVGIRIRSLLREAKEAPYRLALKETVEIFFQYVAGNRFHFSFISRERLGGNRNIRHAIRREMSYIAKELSEGMKEFRNVPGLKIGEYEELSELIISTMFNLAGEFLDVPRGDEEIKTRLLRKSVKQLRLILRGALWNELKRIKKHGKIGNY
ncbi:MAG: TetR family transcriptional regulator [Leptospiraceae bacterium]|nr:TetR family transcriptional regulator [Leptospiraceae bacterium]